MKRRHGSKPRLTQAKIMVGQVGQVHASETLEALRNRLMIQANRSLYILGFPGSTAGNMWIVV
jgi:hypothetical protein